MPIIENCSREHARSGIHKDMGSNAIAIQIGDPGETFPTLKADFLEVHQFNFYDCEGIPGVPESGRITLEQAKLLVQILQEALHSDVSVMVHCHAGIFRSGAVVEVAKHMGFKPVEKLRIPNRRVYEMCMMVLKS